MSVISSTIHEGFSSFHDKQEVGERNADSSGHRSQEVSALGKAQGISRFRSAVRTVIKHISGQARPVGKGCLLHETYWTEAIDPKHRGAYISNMHQHWKNSGTRLNFWTWVELRECTSESTLRDLGASEDDCRSCLEAHDEALLALKCIDLDKMSFEQIQRAITAHQDGGGSVACTIHSDGMTLDASTMPVNLKDHEVRYLTPNERENYRVANEGNLLMQNGAPMPRKEYAFVMGFDHSLFAGVHEVDRFHHSTFFAGKPVFCAGKLSVDKFGNLVRITDHSGHYRPTVSQMLDFLEVLETEYGVDLSRVQLSIHGQPVHQSAKAFLDAHRPKLAPSLFRRIMSYFPALGK